MPKDFEHIAIYTDIDTLFDTRLATLNKLDPGYMEKSLSTDYYERVSNEFEGIDTESFKVAYASRDKNTLKFSMITPAIEVIRDFAKRTLTALINSPLRRQPKVIVNSYPYSLNDKEAELIITGIRKLTKEMIDIEIIHRPIEAITPEFIKENCAAMCLYDYGEWLGVHSSSGALQRTPIPNITLFTAALFSSKENVGLVFEGDPTRILEMRFKPFIGFSMIPVAFFCADMSKLKRISDEFKRYMQEKTQEAEEPSS